ncbi:Uncharacterised protein [Chlamydia abortus]|uniref:Uncharacterized protein n=1 Tax=Paenibacillus residui TaxID=629724 RepID=A0ABW3D7I1_9BACL|nr:Uncharacterised protein [Chlamydia abortus]
MDNEKMIDELKNRVSEVERQLKEIKKSNFHRPNWKYIVLTLFISFATCYAILALLAYFLKR